MGRLPGRAVLLVLLVAATARPAAADGLRVAIAPVEGTEVPEEVRRAVQDVLAGVLARRPDLNTVSDDDVRRLLAHEAHRQLLGREDDAAMAQAVRMLDVDRLVRCSLTRLEDFWLLSLALIDTRDGLVVSRTTRRIPGDRAALVDALPDAVGELLEIPARIHVSRQVAGGRLYVDDALVGEMPLPPFPVRGTGRAVLRAEHFDHVHFVTEIELSPGRTTRVMLDMPSYAALHDMSRARRRTGWLLVGGGVLAAGAGAFAASEGWSAYRAYQAMDARTVSQLELDAAARRSRGLVFGGYAGLGAAATLLGTGVYLLAVDPHRARLEVSGAGGGLNLTF